MADPNRLLMKVGCRKNKEVPLLCLRPALEGPMNSKTFGVTDVSKCYMMSKCVTYISIPNWHIFAFSNIFVS
jgi:hypothetical protein